ncbi:TPA: DUF3850 domain-containing protein [Klebsiella pneumoniae subsp. ozaenae]|nr:DUF3850 domain-containing protein [Klebsiella pneumoniae subsp. ozaenae]
MTKSNITREPITHDINIYPEFFSAVCTGVKRAELRKNDRDYRVGDTLHLMETPRGSCHQTGEFINVKITHIADVGEWMPGYVLLSVELQERRKADSEPVFTLEVSQADYKGQKLGNHFGFITLDAARKLKEGNYQLYRHAQPAPGVLVVPDEIKHRIGGLDWGWEGEFNRGWNACRAAMLQELQKSAGDEVICRSNENVQVLNTIKTASALDSLPKTGEVQNTNYPAIPDGYVMVPKEPTKEMIDAGWLHYMGTKNPSSKGTYKAMLAAAPQEVKGE